MPIVVATYDTGKVDREQLETFLTAVENEIIGWYVFL